MVDYSRFDHVGDDSDVSSEEEQDRKVAADELASEEQGHLQKVTVAKKGKEGRIKFEHEGRTIYEWEQSLDEVNIYISAPPGIKGSQIQCKIETRHLKIGLKGNPPFIDEPTGGPVVVDESLWTMSEDGEININLQKVVDPLTKQEMQKKIMLERFQQENPGFDFSGAEFNGAVPDAATFMGGMRTT